MRRLPQFPGIRSAIKPILTDILEVFYRMTEEKVKFLMRIDPDTDR